MKQIAAVLLGVFLFCLPWQLRLITPMEHSYFTGMFSEYVSGFVYFTDLLFLVLVFAVGMAYVRGEIKKHHASPRLMFILPLIMLVFALISSYQAISLEVVLFRCLKFLQGIVFLWILRQKFLSPSFMITCFVSGISLQALIGLFQYLFQSSLGLSFLGETLLDTSIPGVANIDIGSKQILRAYGTFPHPNLFAGSLVLSFLLLLSLWKKNKQWWLSVVLVLHVLALFVTYSRSAWLAFALSGLTIVVVRFKELRSHMRRSVLIGSSALLALLVVVLMSWPILSVRLNPETIQTSIALTDRQSLLEIGGELLKDPVTLMTGVGLGNFTLAMSEVVNYKLAPWDFQPIHNVFVLLLVELGLPAFILALVFCVWLWRYIFAHLKKDTHHYASSLLACLVAMFVMMNVDHFFWDLQQGILMFWMILGLTAATLEVSKT